MKILFLSQHFVIKKFTKSSCTTEHFCFGSVKSPMHWRVNKQGKTVHTVCSKSLDPFDIISYYIIWIKTSWSYRSNLPDKMAQEFRTYSILDY